MAKFQKGDVVILKSGSPEMTVARYEIETEVLCVWFNRTGTNYTEYAEKTFNEATLEKCEPKAPQRGSLGPPY